MSRRVQDELILDIIDLCRETSGLVHGMTLAEFRRNKPIQRAVERTVELIGEAANQLGADAPDIGLSWHELRGMRVILAHVYHKVDPATVFRAATHSVPALLAALERFQSSAGGRSAP